MMPRMQFTATSTALTEAPAPRIARVIRLRALAIDLGLGAGIQGAFGVVALGVFLLATGGGARDLSSSAATMGWAIALAAAPAWLGYLGRSSVSDGSTPGQSSAQLTVEGGPFRRLARLALHPVGAFGWCWVAFVLALATVPGLPLIVASMAVCVLGGGVISALLVAHDPDALVLHDRLAGTRLVAR